MQIFIRLGFFVGIQRQLPSSVKPCSGNDASCKVAGCKLRVAKLRFQKLRLHVIRAQPATRNFRLQSVLFDEVFDELERRFVIGTDVVFVRIVYGVVVLVRIAVLVHEEHYRNVFLGKRPVVAVFVEFVAV